MKSLAQEKFGTEFGTMKSLAQEKVWHKGKVWHKEKVRHKVEKYL